MKMSIDEMANLVFKRSEVAGQDDSTRNDMHAFNILMALDGKRSVAAIAKDDFYELEELAGHIEKMLDQGLIEPAVPKQSQKERRIFFEQLEAELSRVMGPVSNILIEEKVSESGHSAFDYPMTNARQLVDLLSQTIPDKGEAETFKRGMADVLKTLG